MSDKPTATSGTLTPLGEALVAAPPSAEAGMVLVPKPKGFLGVLEKVGKRLRDFYGNRFALAEPAHHTDNERQVLLAALQLLDAALKESAAPQASASSEGGERPSPAVAAPSETETNEERQALAAGISRHLKDQRRAQTNAAPQGQAVPEIRVREREEAGASPAVAAPLSSAAPSAAQLIVTPEMVKAGSKAIDDYYHGTKDAPFEGSVEACYRAMRVLESSALSSGGEKIADLKRQLAAEREHGQNLQSLLDDTRRANESLRSTTVPSSATENIERLVDRFLNWPLPASVCSDLCVTRIDYPHQRIGTNLLTADEARQMLEYVLAESSTQSANAATIPPKMPRLSLNDPDYDGEQDIYNQGWNACRQAMSNSADSGDEEPRGDKHE